MIPRVFRADPVGKKKGWKLVEVHVCADEREAHSAIAGYRGTRGYRTAIKQRCVSCDRVRMVVFVATVWAPDAPVQP